MDEINQGMDARNERMVFDLLVKTACSSGRDGDGDDDEEEEGGGISQYFLLTPKLLPDLDYGEEDSCLDVLMVHSGIGMCSHTEWRDGHCGDDDGEDEEEDEDGGAVSFVEAARRLSNG